MKQPRIPRPPLRDVTDAEVDEAIGETMAATDVPDTTALHDLFNQQIRAVLEDAGLSEEDKQSVLVAMSCPCCGGGSGSFTYKLKPKE
jgi:hypothetical protein